MATAALALADLFVTLFQLCSPYPLNPPLLPLSPLSGGKRPGDALAVGACASERVKLLGEVEALALSLAAP
jgi:hypothetical protein